MDDDDKTRRNLIVFSAAIFLIHFLNLSIVGGSDELSVLGLKLSGINKENQARIWLLLLGCLIYLSMRFWISDETYKNKFAIYEGIRKWCKGLDETMQALIFPTCKSVFWRNVLFFRIWKNIAENYPEKNSERTNIFHRFINLYWQTAGNSTYWSEHTLAGIVIKCIPTGLLALFTPWGKWTTSITVPVTLAALAVGVCLQKIVVSIKDEPSWFTYIDHVLDKHGYEFLPDAAIYMFAITVVVYVYYRIVFKPITNTDYL